MIKVKTALFCLFCVLYIAMCILVLKWGVEYNSQRTKITEALILEAAGEPREGMYAVACVFRNRLERGMSLGASGLNRRDKRAFIEKQPRYIRDMASRFYSYVFLHNSPDITDGATNFESTDFPVPDWAKYMVKTCQIGKHIFYKEKTC